MTDELHNACVNGDLDQVTDLVENKGATVNQPHSVHLTYPIYFAAQNGHLEIIRYLLSKGANISDDHNAYGNLLYWACCCADPNKQRGILEDIYQNFAEYHFLDGTTKTHVAACLNHLDELKIQMSELLVPNNDGVTPIYFALLRYPKETIKLMEDKKIDFSQVIVKLADIPHDDSWHRNYLQLMSFLVHDLTCKNMLEQALEMCTRCLAAHEQIRTKIEKDNIDLDGLYRCIARLFYKIAVSQFTKEEYQLAIKAYGDAIAAIQTVKSKTDADMNHLDTFNRKIGLAFNTIYNIHYKRQEYQQSIDANKNSIAAYEKIKNKTEKDLIALDIEHRNIAKASHRIAKIHCEKEEYQDVIAAFKNSIVAIEGIKNKNEQDLIDLDTVHRSIANVSARISVNHYMKKEYHDAIAAFKNSIVTIEGIKNKNEQDLIDLDTVHRSIANVSARISVNHYMKKEYHDAIAALKNSIVAYEKIKNKTEEDKKHFNGINHKIAISFGHISESHKQNQSYAQEVDALNCELDALEKITQKTDAVYRQMSKNLKRLGDIYSDITILPTVSQHVKVDPMLCYQNAIAALSNIQDATADDYVSLAGIFNSWRECCDSTTLTWSFTQFAHRSFSPGADNILMQRDFLRIHTELVNARNWQNNAHLIRPMSQLMELLFKNYNKQHFPNNPMKSFLSASEDNREWFRSKLEELKQLPLLSLEQTMLANIHPLITVVRMVRDLEDKAKKAEAEIKALKDKNQALEDQVAQLKQGSTAETMNSDSSNKNDGAKNIESEKPAATHLIQRDSPLLAVSHRPAAGVDARGAQKRKLGDPADEEQPAKTTCIATHEPEPLDTNCSSHAI